MSETPPNILYLHSHDTGRYVQPYGHIIGFGEVIRIETTHVSSVAQNYLEDVSRRR